MLKRAFHSVQHLLGLAGSSSKVQNVQDRNWRQNGIHNEKGNDEQSIVLSTGRQDTGSVLPNNVDDLPSISMKKVTTTSLREEGKCVAVVKLAVREEKSLGIVVSGGTDKGAMTCIADVLPGSVAWLSDAFEPGDLILSVNSVSTAGLSHAEVVNLLVPQPHSVTQIEIEYELPAPLQNLTPCIAKCTRVTLDRDGSSSYGFTLRGGVCSEFSICRPLMVTQIRPGSSADRDGRLKVGDRVLEINDADVTKVTLSEALKILNQSATSINLLVEYNVSVIEAVENAFGPLLVEIDRPFCCSLGVELISSVCHGRNIISISSIAPASIADRCGALHVGDEVLSINDVCLESASVAEAMRQLQSDTGERLVLEILPKLRGKAARLTSASSSLTAETSSTITTVSTIERYASLSCISNRTGSMATQVGSAVIEHHRPGVDARRQTLCSQPSNVTSVVSLMDNSMIHCHEEHTCHVDVTDVTLVADNENGHFGIGIDSSEYSAEGFVRPPFINFLGPGGVAERSGLLQEGDRVLAINGWSLRGRTMQDVSEMIAMSRDHLTLRIEFDVADSIVSSSGTYLVKMAKRGTGVGISISCPKNRLPGQPLVISDVKKGSIAHRTGTISPGDYLLAVGDVWLDNHSLEEAARILTSTDRIVKLRIQKNECYTDEPDPQSVITYNVELPRFAGRLGIALSCRPEPPGTIVIASLTPEGLAEKTGALRVGDRVLAINGVTLCGQNVEDAIRLLPTTDNAINIKVMRRLCSPGSRKESSSSGSSRSSRIVNLDSVLESWDGWGHDHSVPRLLTPGIEQLSIEKTSFDSRSNTADVFCDLDQSAVGRPRFNCNLKTSPRTSSPLKGTPARLHQDTSVASEFVSPDTGRAPSSIDFFGGAQLEPSGLSRDQGVVTSTVIFDELDVVVPATATPANTLDQSSAAPRRTSVSPLEELVLTSLQRSTESDGFGFSLSNGVYESGIYVGAVKQDGPAAEKLQPFDRILKVNGFKVADMTCAEVVPLIAQVGCQLELIISRRSSNIWNGNSLPHNCSDLQNSVLSFLSDEQTLDKPCELPGSPLKEDSV